MTRSILLKRFLSLSMVATTASSFQVDPRPRTPYKNAIDQATSMPFIPIDDDTYSTKVPCPLTTQEKTQYSPEKKHMNNLLLSDSLRFTNFIREIDTRPVTLPLSQSGVTTKLIPPRRNAIARTVVGRDEMPAEYWFDNRIHTFGNTGMWGGVHAMVAPLATFLIDNAAYNGQNAREMISEDLQTLIQTPNACILDMCCGVGMSTRALSNAFKDAQYIVGVDTSPEMISMARFISSTQNVVNILKSFRVRRNFITDFVKMIVEIQIALSVNTKKNLLYARGNVERVKAPMKSFDLVTIMYGFHEIPKTARYRILREARRLLKDGGLLAVIDISEDYNPSPTMLAGEPYVLEYQQNIDHQMDSIQGFINKKSTLVLPGHVRMWTLTRGNNSK